MPQITKRAFLAGLAASASAASLGRAATAPETAPVFAPQPGAWKSYEVTTSLDLAATGGVTQAWIPLPSVSNPSWVIPLGNDWHGENFEAKEVDSGGAKLLHVVWTTGTAAPSIAVRSRFATRARAVNWNAPGHAEPLSAAERLQFTSATQYIPVTGPIKTLSDKITSGASGDRAQVAAIYDWVVCNTYRDGKVKGCGTGNVAAMLKYADFGGKCADLNGLFVGLVRAAGIPARDIYGIRVAPSAFGYHSLGANTADITKAQHCRAEVYLEGYGWVAMDPADVRKVMLEEVKGGLPLTDPRVVAARQGLFGGWEGNWMPYNHVNDVVLPGGGGRSLPFLMYPQAQAGGVWADPLAPKTVKYDITAQPI
jgi:transglutaminase-like putative cysteine protease